MLNFYNMTFDNVLDGGVGKRSCSSCGPRHFLDVGSGCGQVTTKVLLPNIPEDVEVVGVDVCENMVSHARKYSSHPRIAYEQLDITGDVSEFLALYGPFDRIYVFNSLNRVKDQRAAYSNMAKLLKPGGECLLFYAACSDPRIAYEQLDITGDVSQFLALYGPFDRLYAFNSLNRVKEQRVAWSNMAKLLKPGGECLLFYGAWYVSPEIWRALAKRERWIRFAERWESIIPLTQDMRSTEERLNYAESLAKEVGFELRSCEMAAIHLPLQEWSGMLTALIPGNSTLTAEEKQLLFQDANEELQNWLRGRPNPRLADNFVIHAVKPMKLPQ
ncbi:hypothetical protein HPB50_009578 [Hyalomma asiaticum]|uniref:Uncharacterized protein n=1 Tax=Hyalomma asiaticum TaxID=266040 RepID=A0ACB7RMQ7_HYAAI|nr:hypothetical protein HPB50_009578 [Hyalomma asiaticum]